MSKQSKREAKKSVVPQKVVEQIALVVASRLAEGYRWVRLEMIDDDDYMVEDCEQSKELVGMHFIKRRPPCHAVGGVAIYLAGSQPKVVQS